jgi:iron complex outermembrane receptor protein
MTRRLPAFLGALLFAATAVTAQDATQAPSGATDEQKKEEDVVKREEVVVVTASKVESTLINAPATMSVITPDVLATSPAQNYGDLLRTVPGLNVIQMSARDINITSRQSTSTLSNSQLALLDGRSIYLDFFGLILWDLVPSGTNEIKQIEVVRGPASAVWGANALTGVVNIITKSPRDLANEGVGSLTLTGGIFNRDDGSRAGSDGHAFGGNIYFAQAPSDKVSYKLSAGYYDSDPFSRPVGRIPVIPDPRIEGARCNPSLPATVAGNQCIGGASYPADRGGLGTFENDGTKQPKVDLRIDQELSDGGRFTYSGGYAGTTGIVHTGIGPFNLQSGSYLGYGRIGYSKGALKVGGFVNFLDAEAPNLLLRDPAGRPVQLNFKTQTFDFEIGHTTVVGGKHILSYGGNARRNNFEITLAPNAKDRNEFGAYFQDEIFFDKFRFTLGGRVDKFGNLEDPVFSPRVTAMFKPTPAHSFRVSYNKAFRAPSVINNYLSQAIIVAADLRALAPFTPPALRPFVQAPLPLVVNNVGNVDLKEESLTAYELAYTGTFNRTTIGLAVYQNEQDDNINFTNLTPRLPGYVPYTVQDPPPGIPGAFIGFLGLIPPPAGPILLPKVGATYLNLGPTRQRGFEASIQHSVSNELSLSANYSWQDRPEILDADSGQIPYPIEELAWPAQNRFNASINYNGKRFIGTGSVNYSDEALWTDVLSKDFHGFTDSYTMVNATLGLKWLDGKLTTSVKGINIFNQKVQQHIYGDILKRQLFGEVRLLF